MQKNRKESNVILQLTFDFSLAVIEYCTVLENERKYTIANQLLRSATSIGANFREAQNAESKYDFIHKFKIAAKEADETEYWLELCSKAKDFPKCDQLLKLLQPIMKVINKIIASSKVIK